MSSNTFLSELEPEAGLRGLVLLSGSAMAGSGFLLILTLPLHLAAIAAGAVAWLLISVLELRALRRGFQASVRLRIMAGGSMMRQDQEGRWHKARLLPGSVVLPGLAWIRFETARGLCATELLRGRCSASDDWRRLQVIWRHIGAAV